MSKLPNCHLCGNQLVFHQDSEDCPSGCHYVDCTECKYFMDFYGDDTNQDTLAEVREAIAKKLFNSTKEDIKL